MLGVFVSPPEADGDVRVFLVYFREDGVAVAAVVHVHEHPAGDAEAGRECGEARGVLWGEGVALEIQAQDRTRQLGRRSTTTTAMPTPATSAGAPPREAVGSPPRGWPKVGRFRVDQRGEVRDEIVERGKRVVRRARLPRLQKRHLARHLPSRRVREAARVGGEHLAVGGERAVHVEAGDALAPHRGHPRQGPVHRRVLHAKARHAFELM